MYPAFDYSLDFKRLNFRQRPDLYRIGKGEQDVLLIGPYKSELLPHWRFKTPALARKSAQTLYQFYQRYSTNDDFVGMDMARKFLQMGYTRARRYANHRSGRKYERLTGAELPRYPDPLKAAAARVFFRYWYRVRTDPVHRQRRQLHRERYEVHT